QERPDLTVLNDGRSNYEVRVWVRIKRLSDYFQSFSLFNYLIFPHIFPTAVYLYTGQPHQNNVSLGNKRSFQPPPLPYCPFS
ncbi:hypothetical protein, partial [Bacteroides fragilis]|uniref:hypothetical protein n=1 Tax=Bacteroides fragilis TaxID=817 RepID=UPI001E623A9B